MTSITGLAAQDGNLVEDTSVQLGEPNRSVWVDVVAPAHALAEIEGSGVLFTEDAEFGEIEATSRFYESSAALWMQLNFLEHTDTGLHNVHVAVCLMEDRLVTYHERPIHAIKHFALRAKSQPELLVNGQSALIGLLQSKVDHLADVLEQTHVEFEQLSHAILRQHRPSLESALLDLADIEGRNGEIRLDLMDTQRGLSSLYRSRRVEEHRDSLTDILRDIDSLTAHTAFLLEGINFLSSTVMGLIDVQQNQIMKVLSVVAAVFLPPTLIASLYGMNFVHMPELSWIAGYPLALVAMVAFGVAPYLYAKRRGWM